MGLLPFTLRMLRVLFPLCPLREPFHEESIETKAFPLNPQIRSLINSDEFLSVGIYP